MPGEVGGAAEGVEGSEGDDGRAEDGPAGPLGDVSANERNRGVAWTNPSRRAVARTFGVGFGVMTRALPRSTVSALRDTAMGAGCRSRDGVRVLDPQPCSDTATAMSTRPTLVG